MDSDTRRRQERIDRTEDRRSPSAGWRTVYAVMGVPTDGGAEADTRSTPRENHTLDEYVEEASSRSDRRAGDVDRRALPSD